MGIGDKIIVIILNLLSGVVLCDERVNSTAMECPRYFASKTKQLWLCQKLTRYHRMFSIYPDPPLQSIMAKSSGEMGENSAHIEAM